MFTESDPDINNWVAELDRHIDHGDAWIARVVAHINPTLISAIYRTIAEHGRVNMLDALLRMHPLSKPTERILCTTLARYGQIECLKVARKHGCDWCPRTTCSYAANFGHLATLKWLRVNGCKWDTWTPAYAAKNGHLDMLKWIRTEGCDWDNELVCEGAYRGGHTDVHDWIAEEGEFVDWI